MNFAAPPGSKVPSHEDPDYKKWLEEEQKLIDRYQKRPDMSWRDHLVMLLTFGAAAEHCLMVQYLYAAYSLHTDDTKRSPTIENWRSNILAICKEEMGHLLTVQNILLFLGAPATLMRDNSVWAQKYYPYPFSLDPLNLDSIRCFVYAEMPDPDSQTYADLPKKDRDALKKLVKSVDDRFGGGKADVHRVGALYDEIIDLISDEQRIPDIEFDESSYEFQASWDAWGRGYRPSPYELDAEGSRKDEDEPTDAPGGKQVPQPVIDAYVRVDRVATRTEAVNALVAIATQGEAPELRHKSAQVSHKAHESNEPSHFERFFAIYKQMLEEKDNEWAKDVCKNPTTQQPDDPNLPPGFSPITAVVGKRLAQVFNQRYRLLLSYLAHSFRIAGSERVERPNRRAMLMHRVFGEMYNLKTLAGLLVRTPRIDLEKYPDHGNGKNAGPPFEMPYSLSLPDSDVDIWRAHLDLIETSQTTCRRLLYAAAGTDTASRKVREELDRLNAEPYVRTVMALDDQARAWIRAIIAGVGSKGAVRL